eukprot:11176745-Lingulodinium_polyedra.AAC.1
MRPQVPYVERALDAPLIHRSEGHPRGSVGPGRITHHEPVPDVGQHLGRADPTAVLAAGAAMALGVRRCAPQ